MRRDQSFLFVIGITFLLMVGPVQSPVRAAKSMSDLTGSWQLFVDDYLIATKTNVVRKYHPFKKHPANPVILPDKPWMDHVVTSGVVLPNEDGKGYSKARVSVK